MLTEDARMLTNIIQRSIHNKCSLYVPAWSFEDGILPSAGVLESHFPLAHPPPVFFVHSSLRVRPSLLAACPWPLFPRPSSGLPSVPSACDLLRSPALESHGNCPIHPPHTSLAHSSL